MNEFLRLDTLIHLALWLAIALIAMLIPLLPLYRPDDAWPQPEWFLALTFAWLLRRPAHLPYAAIGLVFLIQDLFLMRPPGLWAMLVMIGAEFLRRRQSMVREMNTLMEWGLVTGVLVAIWLANRLALVIVMTPRPPLDLSLVQLVGTVLTYPVVVVFVQSVLRIRKPATGELDELGRKL
ncbi:MAG: rod shape-determining protein MreD [Paracoccaceae bacterium]